MSATAMLAGAAPGRAPNWHSTNWKAVYRNVRRLQARIVKAVRGGRWNQVKALVYLLTHSFSGRALAILRVISNSGARTPGVDGILWNTPEAKSAAFSALRRHGYRPQPLRRVYIPKSNGKLRGLGIRTRWVKIRSAANPYDPEWELYLEQRLAWKLTHTLAGRGRIEYLWKEQQGRCVVCGQALCIEEQPWHIHHRVWRSQGGQETCDNLEMLHANCHRQIHSKKESLKDQAASCEGR